MAAQGKTIRIYLVDAVPNGVMTAEIMNWTGKVVIAPRSQLQKLADRQEAKRTGLYILVGEDPEVPSKERVYVGESDNVFKRLIQHHMDESKDFWTRAVLVISKDENLTKSHVRYLESRLISIVKKAKRANLANGTEPPESALPEPDVADMEFFLDQVQMLLPVLGFPFTQLPPTLPDEDSAPTEEASPVFAMSTVGTQATAQEINGEFIVFKGSTARMEGIKSWTSYRTLRDQLLQESKLVPSDKHGFYVFTEDVPFASPSAAAAVVVAGNKNGRLAWKVKDTGTTYNAWQESQVKDAANAYTAE